MERADDRKKKKDYKWLLLVIKQTKMKKKKNITDRVNLNLRDQIEENKNKRNWEEKEEQKGILG